MRVQDYSKAVFELIKNGESESHVLKALEAMLLRRGHTRLYPKILRNLLIQGENLLKSDAVVVTVAHDDDATALKSEIAEAITSLGGKTHETQVDETITGGFIAQGKGKRIDQSYKKQLLTIYRNLTES